MVIKNYYLKWGDKRNKELDKMFGNSKKRSCVCSKRNHEDLSGFIP